LRFDHPLLALLLLLDLLRDLRINRIALGVIEHEVRYRQVPHTHATTRQLAHVDVLLLLIRQRRGQIVQLDTEHFLGDQ